MSLGKPRFEVPATTSTMDDARILARDGAADGTTVVAARQLEGRGRAGRSWESPPGGLWMSIVLRPRRDVEHWGILPLAFGAALADYAGGMGAEAGVKWPNDVLVRDRKLAGVLVEARAPIPGRDDGHVIAGIGLNLDPAGLPSEGVSLQEATNRPIERRDVVDSVLRALDARYRAFERGLDDSILDEWACLSVTLGRRVRAGEPPLEGRAVALDRAGSLVLEKTDGSRVRLNAGDVREIRPSARDVERRNPQTSGAPTRGR